MQLRHAAAASVALILLITAHAHDITQILAKFPEFSTFNNYLTLTQLVPEINRRQTITVCSVDNATMEDLLAMNLTIATTRKVLSVHVILDYFDDLKLHEITDGSALAATIFQASGGAPGSTGMVNITELRGGQVAFFPEDNNGVVTATYIKPIAAIPYDISVIQISASLLLEDELTQSSKFDLTALMMAHGCKRFAETLLINAAQQIYDRNAVDELTIFCPKDNAMESFIPIYNRLSEDNKQAVLDYHAMPVYESLTGLKWRNGPMTTLSTDGAKKYALNVKTVGPDVTLETEIVTAKIVSNLIDQKPLAIFGLDKVLLPKELFKSGFPPSLAPAPAPIMNQDPAPVPESGNVSPRSPPAPATPMESPADAPEDDDVADDIAEINSAHKIKGVGFGALIESMFTFVVLFSSLCF